MLATMEYENSPSLMRMEENTSMDNHHVRIPWLNFLTAQAIPEETDGSDYSKYQHDDSGCSSSSEEDSYVVLEVQRPRVIDREQDLQFADVQHMKYNEVVQPLVIETPLKRNAAEYLTESLMTYENSVIVLDLPFLVKEIPTEQHRTSALSIHSIENQSPLPEEEQSSAFPRPCLRKVHPMNSSALNRSSILRFDRKHYRAIQSEYYPCTAEPSLLQMKYFDGRPTLIDLNAVETFEKSRQSPYVHVSTSPDSSYRKRIFNRLQNFLRYSPFGLIHPRRNKKTTC